jgi:tetratricopeptide (TPR) repeat protein
MSDPADALGDTLDVRGPSSAEQLRDRYVAAWEAALRGGTPPEIEPFLGLLVGAERARLCQELEALREQYQGRFREVATLPVDGQAGSATEASSAPPGTVELAADTGAPVGTVDFTPNRATQAADAGRTYAPSGRAAPSVETVAGYEILSELGRGAMGVVYQARQRSLKRLVALKMILAGGHAGAEELARFRREAEAVARLQHPNIVQIYEVGETNGRPFFSLEHVDGDSLLKNVRAAPLPPPEAARVVQLLAVAMQYAHEHGIVHRDLKPANVLLTADGTPKITDFGLARQLDGDAGQTYSGAVLGTPAYMPPEQAEGRIKEVGPLADVYALGAILYELLTGRPPFQGTSVLDTLEQVRTKEAVPVRQLQPKVPRDLETICLKCLQKSPERRYASAGALAEDLRRFQAGEPIQARPVGSAERLWRWCRRNPRVALLCGGAALAVVFWAVTATWLMVQLRRETDAKEAARLEAETNAAEARRNADQARTNEETAKRNEQAALRSEHKALRNAETAVNGVLGMGEELLKRLQHWRRQAAGPETVRLRDDLLGTLRQMMLRTAGEIEKDQTTSFAAVAAYQRLGDLLKRLGLGEEALRQFNKGYLLAKKLLPEQRAHHDKAQANLAVMVMRLGEMALELNGDGKAARMCFERSQELHQELLDRPVSREYSDEQLRVFLSQDDARLAWLDLDLGRPADARTRFAKALDFRADWARSAARAGRDNSEARSFLAEAYVGRGICRGRLGDGEAAADYQECLRLCNELAGQFPNNLGYRKDLVDSYGYYGDYQLRRGLLEEAGTSYRQSLKELRGLLARRPDETELLLRLAQAEERLAALARAGRRPTEATDHDREALKLRREFVDLEPNNLTWRAAYLLAQAHAGETAAAARGADALRRRAPQSIPLLVQVARCHAACAAGTAQTERQRELLANTLDALTAAVKLGYRDRGGLETDPDLTALRDEPAFRELLARMAAR